MIKLASLIVIALATVAALSGQNVQNANIRGLKNRVFSVIDYGATGNGTTDDTAAIQRAIAAASVSGGVVDIPRGTYKFSRLTVTAPKVTIQCADRRTTALQSTVTTGKVISFLNATASTYSGGGMRDCTIYGFANIAQVAPTGTETGLDITAALDVTQIVVASNVATATTTTASGVVAATTTFVIAGATGDTDLNGSYTVATTPTPNTFTFATSSVSDGTYTEATLRVYTAARWDNMTWRNLEFRFVSNGVVTDNEVDSRFDDISVQVAKPASGVNLYVKHGHERWFNRFSTYNPAGSESKASIRIGDGSIGDYFNAPSLLGSVDGVLIDPAIGYGVGGNTAEWGHFTDIYTDSMTGCGVNIAPQASGSVSLWVFNNTWASNVVKGFCLTAGSGTVANIQINGGRIRSSGNGIHLSGPTAVQIRNANIDANGGHGIYALNTTGLDIQSNRITDTKGYAVYLTGTTDQANITGNTMRGMSWTKASATLTSIAVATNVGTLTTSQPHGLVSGNQITISGATVDTDLNATYTVVSAPTTATLTFATSSVTDATYTESTLVAKADATIFDDSTNLNKWIGGNDGVDEVGQTVASATSIVINDKPLVILTGTTTVTTITGAPGWGNRRIYIQATDSSPASPTLNTGGNIFSAVTLVQNQIVQCVYSTIDSKWHCE